MTRPCGRLRMVASYLCGPRTLERVVDPILADLQQELAGTAMESWRGRLRLWRGYLVLWKALGLHCIMQTFQPIPSQSPSGLGKVAVFTLAALVVLTALITIPPLMGLGWFGGPAERAWLAVLMVPQALPLTIPAAVCIGIACAMRGRRVGVSHLTIVLFVVVVATVSVWTLLEWGVPAANQEFRSVVAERLEGRPVNLEPGLNELGLSRLSERTDPPAVHHSRLLWALCFATVPLALFALGLSVRVRHFRGALAASLVGCVVYLCAVWVIDDGLRDGMFRGIAAWLPNIGFALTGAMLLGAGGRLRLEAGGDGTIRS